MLNSAVSLAQVPDLVPVPMQGSGPTTLPNIGGEGGGMSWVEEREFGDYIAGLIQQDKAYEQDPLLHDYVAAIWQRLLDAASRDGELSAELKKRMAWEMYLIRDPSVNAFALPGAYVGVHLGLISAVETQDELASVLAHESVHIFQRHITRSYGLSKDLSALSLATAILGVVALAIDPNIGGAILTGGQAAAIQGQINFTRTMEHEADRIGYKVLVDAGFKPQGMEDMFKLLAQASRFSDATSFPYLRTHPLNDVRIAEAQMRFGVHARPQGTNQDWQQDVMGARALVLSDVKPDSLRALVDAAYDASAHNVRGNATVKMLYAGAFAALKLRQFDVANAISSELLLKVKNEPVVFQIIALQGVEIALSQGDTAKAQERMAQVNVQSMPALQRTALFMRAQIALALEDGATTVKLLEPWVRAHAQDAFAWELLSRAYRFMKQPVLALRSDAEMRMVVGDYDGAIDRFKAALNQGNSSNTTVYDLEVIQARLKVAQQAQVDRHKMLR
ncbi:MAG: M48 family metalloprotease [Saezia sp.]